MDDEQQRQPRTLKTVFAEAETKREALEGTYEASSRGYREALAEAIVDYEECLHLISSLGIFSPNESADDIATRDLPYLTVSYHLADHIQKPPTSSPSERRPTRAAVPPPTAPTATTPAGSSAPCGGCRAPWAAAARCSPKKASRCSPSPSSGTAPRWPRLCSAPATT